MTNFDNLLAFVDFVNQARLVERVVLTKGSARRENDAEHSFQLAIVGWYLIDTYKLKLDLKKVLMYCLTHDLVEIYAGDTYFNDEKAIETKEDRERLAFKKIKNDHPEFSNLIKCITSYEQRKDHESKFVYALDKLIPIINIYQDNGKTWKLENLKFETLLSKKSDKIKVSPEVNKIFKKLVILIKKDQQILFGNAS